MENKDRLPKISVIIPAFNEEKVIGKCLDSVVRIDYPKELLDIIVIDDGSTDKTSEIIKKYTEIRVIQGHHKGPSAARNLAIKEAKGNYLAFTDADCIVPSNWIKALLDEFISPEIAGAGGVQRSPNEETDFGKLAARVLNAFGFIAGYTKVKKLPGEIEHNPSCNVIYRAEILKKIGGFDEDIWPGEDVELDYKIRKLGYRFRQNPAVAVGHFRPESFGQYDKMMRRYGMSQAYLVKKHGIFRHLQIVPFITPLILLLLLAMAVLIGPVRALSLTITSFAVVLFLFGLGNGGGVDPMFYVLIADTIWSWHLGFYRNLFLKGGRE